MGHIGSIKGSQFDFIRTRIKKWLIIGLKFKLDFQLLFDLSETFRMVKSDYTKQEIKFCSKVKGKTNTA